MERSNDLPITLTAREVAHVLNIHVNTVRRWENRGIMRAYRIGRRGDRRFKQTEILRVMREVDNRNNSESNELVNNDKVLGKSR